MISDAEAIWTYMRFVDQSALPALLTDAEGRFLHGNGAFHILCGHPLDSMIGQKPKAFLHGPATEDDVHREVSRKLQVGYPFHFETTNYHFSGVPYTVFVFITPFRNSKNRITHFMALEFPTFGIGKAASWQHLALSNEIERLFFNRTPRSD